MDMTTRDGINTTLKIIGAAGFSGMVIVAPNAVQALGLLLKKTKVEDSSHERIMKELKRQGLVHITQTGQELEFTITPAGAHRLQQVIIDELSIPKPAKWDHKWRMVAFDVPLRQSKERAQFTSQLHALGFKIVQKSMWAHPFPCFEIVEQLAGHYNLARYCTLFEVERIDDLSAQKLARHFSSILE
jgi:DNA-binding transcriptional regulator PaaX